MTMRHNERDKTRDETPYEPTNETPERNENTDCLTRRPGETGDDEPGKVETTRHDEQDRGDEGQKTRDEPPSKTEQRDARKTDGGRRNDEQIAKNKYETSYETNKRDGERDESGKRPARSHGIPQEIELTKTAHHLRPQADTRKIERAAWTGRIERDGGTRNQITMTPSDDCPTRRPIHRRPSWMETIRTTQTREKESRQEASQAKDRKESQMPPARLRR